MLSPYGDSKRQILSSSRTSCSMDPHEGCGVYVIDPYGTAAPLTTHTEGTNGNDTVDAFVYHMSASGTYNEENAEEINVE